MVFQGVVARNYRAYEQVTIYPKALTFLLGPNNAGKSSLIQLIKVLSQTASSSTKPGKQSPLNLGGPLTTVLDARDIFRDQGDGSMELQIECSTSKDVVGRRIEYFVFDFVSYAQSIGMASPNKDVQQHFRALRNRLNHSRGSSLPSLLEAVEEVFKYITVEFKEDSRRLLEVSRDLFPGIEPGSRKNPHQMKDEDVSRDLALLQHRLTQELRVAQYFNQNIKSGSKSYLWVRLSLKDHSVAIDDISLRLDRQEIARARATPKGGANLQTLQIGDEGNPQLGPPTSAVRANLNSSIFTFLEGDRRTSASSYIGGVLDGIRSDLASLSPVYVGPHRARPSSVYVVPEWGGNADYLFDVVRRISEDERRTEQLNQIALEFGFHIRLPMLLDSIYALSIGRSADLRHFPASSVGFGLVHLIPILDVLAFAEDGQMIVIEQPEAHLHPELHARIADILISVARAFPLSRFIVETHSDHLLSRIGRRMKDGVYLDMNNVTILYVEQSTSGDSQLRRLEIDSRGEFEWPLGFINSRIQDQVGTLPPIADLGQRNAQAFRT